ncbi:hypothetical protein JW960_16855 [candidate division KSB1 bacterium]|nr:hypothetical protein [candidate division KSB1 bacterium]
MTMANFLTLLLVAGICGAVVQIIIGRSCSGFLISIGIGFVGAFFGVWIVGKLGLPELYVLHIGTDNFPIVWSIIGAGLFVALAGLINSHARR